MTDDEHNDNHDEKPQHMGRGKEEERMNFKQKTHEWGGNVYLRVGKTCYENFIRHFWELGKLEGDTFMGWHDSYDWSLDPNFDEKKANDDECWEHCTKCMVARCHFETYQPEYEYWLRVDYIKANNYDIDTIDGNHDERP